MKTPERRPKQAGGSEVGSIAPNLHEGSRSEILADYLFSSWGTVTPVRRQDDYGVDLSCTLVETVEPPSKSSRLFFRSGEEHRQSLDVRFRRHQLRDGALAGSMDD